MSDEDEEDLHTLLSKDAPLDDWTPIYQRVKRFPQEARQRYFRNESPLQLSLKVRECKRIGKSESLSRMNRIQVLQLIVDADPSSIISRDEEGRTALHTACSAGRSWEILHLLLEAEDEVFRQMKEEQEGGKIKEQRSAMLKTDHPGGNLPLHLIAACPSFHETSFQDSANYFFPYTPLDEGAIQCSLSQNIISAYNATTTVREAFPQAVWDRDCDGEIPLHAAASWGNVGSLLSLLMCSTSLSADGSCTRDISQTLDDRNKTPLDRACERVVAMCVHEKPFRAPNRDNFRESVTREDPFISSARRDRPMNRNIRLSVNQSRRRIPGVGSSFRSSFTSTSTADPADVTMLRDSFISSRQPVHPVLGLKPLCDDGQEEFAKVEMLVRAAQGHFNVDSGRPVLHAIIELGCPPELVWHSAAKYPHEVESSNESGKSPLLLVTEKLSHLLQLRREEKSPHSNEISDAIALQEAADKHSRSDDSDRSDISEAEAARNYFVKSFFLGNDSQLNQDDPVTPNAIPSSRVTDPDPPNTIEEANQGKVDADILMYQEIFDMLIKSRTFGKPVMASIPCRGRLAIHILLEAGELWINENVHQGNDDEESGAVDTARQNPHMITTLIDAYPQALLTRDYETGLFPFMIAAMANNNSEGVNGGRRVLETIFRLLLEGPDVISYCIQQCSL